MSDIVARAKELVEQGFAPPPWGIVRHDFGYDSHFIAGPVELPIKPGEPNIVRECHAGLIAAAPELAQALAEETYEYGVKYKYLTNRGAEWRLDPGVGWRETYRAAERAASASVRYRIVRRRVSPPEVINE